jgi:hypothetical protein
MNWQRSVPDQWQSILNAVAVAVLLVLVSLWTIHSVLLSSGKIGSGSRNSVNCLSKKPSRTGCLTTITLTDTGLPLSTLGGIPPACSTVLTLMPVPPPRESLVLTEESDPEYVLTHLRISCPSLIGSPTTKTIPRTRTESGERSRTGRFSLPTTAKTVPPPAISSIRLLPRWDPEE